MPTRKYTLASVLDKCKIICSRTEFGSQGGLRRAAIRFGLLSQCNEIIDRRTQIETQIKEEDFMNRFEQGISECKSIMEFRQKFPEFVWFINKNLSKYKHRFIRQKFSTQQLICREILENLLDIKCKYDCRTALEGKKELDIYFPQYQLAFEYDSHFWHSSPKIKLKDIAKTEKCCSLGITLIRISEDSRGAHQDFSFAVEDIKRQIKMHLPTINSCSQKRITTKDVDLVTVCREIISSHCYNTQDIEKIIKECSSYAEVRHEHHRVWQYLQKHKLLHLLDPVKRKDYRHMDVDSYVSYIKTECNSYTAFLKHKSFSFAYRRGYHKAVKKVLPSAQHLRSLSNSKIQHAVIETIVE